MYCFQFEGCLVFRGQDQAIGGSAEQEKQIRIRSEISSRVQVSLDQILSTKAEEGRKASLGRRASTRY